MMAILIWVVIMIMVGVRGVVRAALGYIVDWFGVGCGEGDGGRREVEDVRVVSG